MNRSSRFCLAALFLFGASRVFAGFAGTEVFLPAIGRVTGQGSPPAQFYTTVWATNLSGTPVSFTFQFLKQGQANPTPPSFSDTLAAGQTKTYENVVETQLGLTGAIGAARIVSDGEILVSERIFNQPTGRDLGETVGLFFAGVPKSFSISPGESASIQGLNQGGSQNFRYNFALVETGGGSPTVNVQIFDGSGAILGQKAYPLHPYEQIQPNIADVVPGFSSTNARLTATVVVSTTSVASPDAEAAAPAGSVLLAGAQLANASQDSSGFEMSFKDSLLGSGGGGGDGVSSLNGLTGAVSLFAGTNITLANQGNGIKISAAGGVGGGVPSVNGISDAVTIAHGANTTVNVTGSTITIDAVSGSGTGLTAVAHDNTLTGSGTAGVPLGITVPLLLSAGLFPGATLSVHNTTNGGSGMAGFAGTGTAVPVSGSAGVVGVGRGSTAGAAGISSEGVGVRGIGMSASSIGVLGDSQSGWGVEGHTTSGVGGVHGHASNSSPGVYGESASGYGVFGKGLGADAIHGEASGANLAGVFGLNNSSGCGVCGDSASGPAVYGESTSGNGVHGFSDGSAAGVYGDSASGNGVEGKGGAHDGVHGDSTGSASSGVYGHNSAGFGVRGDSDGASTGVAGIYGTCNGGCYAGLFATGNVKIDHDLTVSGAITAGVKDFKIDHPLDPEKRYLVHASIESSEMKNIYDGVALLNESGLGVVELPDWFEALNGDFRYQLTSIGMSQPGLYIAREVSENRFTIAGGMPGAKVSWQVSGVRQDRFAKTHPLVVEEGKPTTEQGYYLHPEAFGQPEEKSLAWARNPEEARRSKEARERIAAAGASGGE